MVQKLEAPYYTYLTNDYTENFIYTHTFIHTFVNSYVCICMNINVWTFVNCRNSYGWEFLFLWVNCCYCWCCCSISFLRVVSNLSNSKEQKIKKNQQRLEKFNKMVFLLDEEEELKKKARHCVYDLNKFGILNDE